MKKYLIIILSFITIAVVVGIGYSIYENGIEWLVLSDSNKKEIESKPQETPKIEETNEINDSILPTTKKLTEGEARIKALELFDEIGEQNLDYKSFKIENITRGNIEYYYVTSPENSIEFEVESGKINRINNVKQ
jgi:hypothetical protein